MKSIVFCSSQRFAKELHQFMDELHDLAGKKGLKLSVLHPEFVREDQPLRHKHEKERLEDPIYRAEIAGKVYDHLFRKVKVADVCFVFNNTSIIVRIRHYTHSASHSKTYKFPHVPHLFRTEQMWYNENYQIHTC